MGGAIFRTEVPRGVRLICSLLLAVADKATLRLRILPGGWDRVWSGPLESARISA